MGEVVAIQPAAPPTQDDMVKAWEQAQIFARSVSSVLKIMEAFPTYGQFEAMRNDLHKKVEALKAEHETLKVETDAGQASAAQAKKDLALIAEKSTATLHEADVQAKIITDDATAQAKSIERAAQNAAKTTTDEASKQAEEILAKAKTQAQTTINAISEETRYQSEIIEKLKTEIHTLEVSRDNIKNEIASLKQKFA